MNDSKNHAVCARCHFAGEHSGDDCTIMSSGVSGLHKSSVRRRVVRNRSAISTCKFGEAVAFISSFLYPESVPETLHLLPARALIKPLYKLCPAPLTICHRWVL